MSDSIYYDQLINSKVYANAWAFNMLKKAGAVRSLDHYDKNQVGVLNLENKDDTIELPVVLRPYKKMPEGVSLIISVNEPEGV